ncbi:MAG: phosphoribosyltransferase family protein [Flavitalea sp.]
MPKKYILDGETVRIKLERMAFEVVENNIDESQIVLVGIEENGSIIARNIQTLLRSICKIDIELISLKIDKKIPKEVTLSENKDFNGKVVLIIDDVANSGKTMLYALKPFLGFQAKKIQTLALVERTHKTFPIHLDYVGLSVATTLLEHIYVEVEGEKIAGAYLQ